MKNIRKTNKICYCLGGEIQNSGGEISPPKGSEKKHCPGIARKKGGFSFGAMLLAVRWLVELAVGDI